MRRASVTWTVLFGLLSCNAQCATCPPPSPDTTTVTPDTATLPETTDPVVQWADNTVPSPFWVARSEQVCRRVAAKSGTWIPQPLLDVRIGGVSTERYCLYLWHGDPKAPDEAALKSAKGLSAEPDPPILIAAAHDAERDAKWFGPWHETLRKRLALPKERPAHPSDAHVRVAVLDSASDSKSGRVLDRMGHGRAVDRLIEEIACDGLSSCATEVVNYPSLPLLSDAQHALGIDALEAGALGTRGILAARIEQATADWLAQRDEPGGARQLVINLSVGWSGCWEGRRDLGAFLVRSAIARATCQGALVVAASGNGDIVPGCPQLATGTPHHMLPGLWGGTAVADTECKRLGVDVTPTRSTATAPLLLGVGVVDEVDRKPMSIDHEANVVAYGQNVVVSDGESDSGWTAALSGTSMGAAALSGMAAALWSYRPDLPRAQLVQILSNAAVPLRAAPTPAGDFVCNDAFAGGCKEIKRLALCPALEQLQVKPLAACEVPKAGEGTVPALQTLLATAVTRTAVDCAACADSTCQAQCQVPHNAGDGDAQDVPWLVPQPKPPACGTCVLHADARRLQVQLLKPVNNLRLVVRVGPTNFSYYLGNVGTSPLEWLLPAVVQSASGALLGYQPVGTTLGVLERGDIPVLGMSPFEGGVLGP